MRAGDPEVGAWGDEGFVAAWSAGDALREVLALPRRLSVALVADAGLRVRRVVDLGAGAGTYLEEFLEAFPEARGTWVDSSLPMRARAEERLGRFGDRVRFVLADLRTAADLPAEPTSVVVSSRALHHFEARTIRAVYHAAHERLEPGGFLFNLDHFAAPGWEPAYRRIRDRLLPPRGDRPAHGHDAPPATLAEHLRWLTDAGFEPPDVPWRLLVTALVAARKPG